MLGLLPAAASADRALLILRVDRKLSWGELAWVVNSEVEFSDGERLVDLEMRVRREFASQSRTRPPKMRLIHSSKRSQNVGSVSGLSFQCRFR